MKFTLKNFSLLITSLLLISNLQSAQQSINSVGGGGKNRHYLVVYIIIYQIGIILII